MDQVRVSVFWATVAPAALETTRPTFDATDPAAYPSGSWDRYDQLVRLATARGIAVLLDVTSPAPLWATGAAPRADIANTFTPDPAQFAAFVQAVGTRYSGSYRPLSAAPAAPPCEMLTGCPPVPAAPLPEPLPRVSRYGVWNEPNQPGWLTPQWTGSAQSGFVEASPRLYRGLVDAAFTGLAASGHAGDTILVGETAPKGLDRRGTTTAMKALHFVRQLYCVDDASHPLAGAAAAARDCPANPADFPAAHPGLFAATGYAHHPYELVHAPDVPPADPDFVTIANLPRLSDALARIFAVYGHGSAGLPLYLTEFGYNTSPPNPAGVRLDQQAAYLDQAEFLARQDPRVRTLTQFLLVDDAPRPGRNGVTAGYGATFQTGLRFLDGSAKPAEAAYVLPLWLPRRRVRAGRTLRVWGMVRPARALAAPQLVRVELTTGRRVRTLATIRLRAGVQTLDQRVRIPASGTVRLRWRDPRGGTRTYSRPVAVRALRR